MSMPDKPMVDNGPAMPDNLPALLQRAAQALPDRFRVLDCGRTQYAEARLDPALPGCGWDSVLEMSSPEYMQMEWAWRLREACEQECAARGWSYEVRIERDGTPSAIIGTDSAVAWIRPGMAPTPAQALLAALLCAVEANNAD